MKIKSIAELERRRIDVSEWNDETEAFFQPLDGPAALVFNDWFLEYRDKTIPTEARFAAAFKAAKATLVDGDGKPVLSDADFDAVKAAAFAPLSRVFTYGLDPDFVDERFKKKSSTTPTSPSSSDSPSR